MKRRFDRGSILVFGCILGLPFILSSPAMAAPGTEPPKLNVQETPLSRDVKAGTSFAPIIKKAAPSVVNIYSTMIVRDRPQTIDPFFRRFFGGEDRSPLRERKAEGLGSGVIISSDGYILTANHVVEGADTVKVALASGEKEFVAKVIGTDPPTDVAVLKIETGSKLPAIAIADSDQLEVGDTVLAIGNPFGVGQTVTSGIASALGRGGFGINDYENFIQTDAAINQGNSGGALVDAEGRLVGINTAILSRSGGNMGVGFAVPINMARFVMDRILKDGKVSRGLLGINIQPLTPDLAKAFRLPDESSGVLVGGVSSKSAAEKAGIKHGDVITELNGKKMSDRRNLQLAIAQNAPGTKVTVRLLRSEGKAKPAEKTVTAILDALPAEAVVTRDGNPAREPDASELDALDGVQLADLDNRIRRQLDIPANIRGAVVRAVDENSGAGKAGLQPGDVIIEIDRQPVAGANAAVTLIQKTSSGQVLLRVWSAARNASEGSTHYVVVNNSKGR